MQVTDVVEGILGWVAVLSAEHQALYDWASASEQHFLQGDALAIGVAPAGMQHVLVGSCKCLRVQRGRQQEQL
jgi:hypothetical protein